MAIYYSTGDSSTKILGTKYAYNSTRTSTSNAYGSSVTLWSPLTYNKLSSTSELHVQGMLVGHGKYSYPYYGVFTRATYSGGNNTMHIGSQYVIGAYINSGTVMWHINQIWYPSELGNQTGNIAFTCEYKASSSSESRPFQIWNPNASDENRAYQMGSTFVVTEREMAS